MKPLLFVLWLLLASSSAFVPLTPSTTTSSHHTTWKHHPTRSSKSTRTPTRTTTTTTTTTTTLYVLLDLPRWYFTTTLVGCGLMLNIAKSFGRMRLEERAWEQRLEEGRRRRLAEDPTLTELDLRRREAELEWSAYGKPRLEAEAIRKEMEQRERELLDGRSRGGRKRVKVMEREEEEEDDDEYYYRSNRMSDNEIDEFEAEFGIDYDPYYDDPYTVDELPEGNFKVDKIHGDRFYEDGEIFYKDAQSGLYYRQGAKPRSSNFFSP